MDIEEIIGKLSNLSLRVGQASAKGNSSNITYNDKGKTQARAGRRTPNRHFCSNTFTNNTAALAHSNSYQVAGRV